MSTTKMYIDEYGTKIYKNSKGGFHKLDGPAVERTNGAKWWYKEDKLHRVDGPAIEYSNGEKYWCLLYKGLEEKEFNSWILRIKIFI